MNNKHHRGTVRCSCWHTTNSRILISGGDDRSIRIWRLYPHNTIFPSNDKYNTLKKRNKSSLPTSNDSNNDIELQYESSSDGMNDEIYNNFNPSIHPLNQLLSLSASGEVKGICMSPTNGSILVAVSSRSFNEKSSLDIFHLPHWTWNYTSLDRISYRNQYQKYLSSKFSKNSSTSGYKNKVHKYSVHSVSSMDDGKVPNDDAFQSSDFCDRPSVIPLPYGARERCLTFTSSKSIVFVGLLSCRKKHHRKYCCLMACNISNGANRPCHKINSLMHRKECIYSLALSSSLSALSSSNTFQLAIGTNSGRLIVVSLKENLDWESTRQSFISDYNIAYDKDPKLQSTRITLTSVTKIGDGGSKSRNQSPKKQSSDKHSKGKKKYTVLTARERTFREMVDCTVSITIYSLSNYLIKQNSDIEKQDIDEFFKFLNPNKKGQISFTQYVQKVDEDGDIMRAFMHFCLTGSSRTDRRSWMNTDVENESKVEENDSSYDDSDGDWQFARSNDGIKQDGDPVTAIQWSEFNNWIITGHMNGEIRFWSKECSSAVKETKDDDEKYPSQPSVQSSRKKRYHSSCHRIPKSSFYFVKRGGMKRHKECVTSLSLSGTYLVSSAIDGDILVWHLDFLSPTVISAQMQMYMQSSSGVVQLLSTIESAHMGEEICDVKLSYVSSSASYFIPNALYLLSSGADESVRCRDVMEVLRQQLSIRILADSKQVKRAYSSDNSVVDVVHGGRDIQYESKGEKCMEKDGVSDGDSSDVGIPVYGGDDDMDYREKIKRLTSSKVVIKL